jgi:hypothetical protein
LLAADQKLVAALCAVSVAAALMMLLVFSLMTQLKSADDLISRSKETAESATIIADAFCEIVTRQSKFEEAVATYIARYFDAIYGPLETEEKRREKWERLVRALDDVLMLSDDFVESLVEKATYVICTKKGHAVDTCIANFKLLKFESGERNGLLCALSFAACAKSPT